jgi:LysR family glycine cleavage system transcriptional activator
VNQNLARTTSTLGLRALRTFEAASRRLNFTKAAQDLFVTTAAISHSIKEFESQLGVPLFLRQGRSVRLTPEGEVMREAVLEAIAALEHGIRRIGTRHEADRVRVSAGPSIAAKWLVPRLESFLQNFPSADIQVDVSYTEADFGSEGVDLSIRYGHVNAAHARTDRLFVESIFPVCSPRLLGQRDRLRSPQELLEFKLIHVDWAAPHMPWPTWSTWMQAAGVGLFDNVRGMHFQQTSLAIEAAIAGQGIALGESSLVTDDLASGRLVKPLGADFPIQANAAYCLVTREESLASPIVREFRRWLLLEAQKFTPA